MIKKLLFSLLLLTMFQLSAQNTKDTTVRVTHDSTIKVNHDSTYKVILPPTTQDFIQGHYLNNVPSWFYTAAGQDGVIKWLIDNKQNACEPYGIDGIIGNQANWKWIARFNDSCSAHGILTAFVWSRSASVVGPFDAFQKAQTRQSAKFDYLKNESEPYNNNPSYALWWSESRIVKNYAVAHGLKSVVYVGWHTQQSSDSCRVLYDQIDIHVYLQSADMSNPQRVYGYMAGRLAMFCHLPGPFNMGMINSNETSFANSYYVANHGDWEAPVAIFKTGFDKYATAQVKTQAKFTKHLTFVSSYSWAIVPIKPVASARMSSAATQLALTPPAPYSRKVLIADGNGKGHIMLCKTLAQIKLEQSRNK